MPKKPKLNHIELKESAKKFLALKGLASAKEIGDYLKVSQPVVSRITSQLRPDLLVVGKASKARYALRRDSEIKIYQIKENGEAQKVGSLIPIFPKGYFIVSNITTIHTRYYDDLPYFIDDLRPSGFLGRLILKGELEIDLPKDPELWTSDQCLKYFSRYGWDLTGNFIFGDDAFKKYLKQSQSPDTSKLRLSKAKEYAAIAEKVVNYIVPGSSAGGDQPKFLATLATESISVLVKFSPPRTDKVSNRIADLLVSEHLAHVILRNYHRSSSNSELVTSGTRTFLAVERFDRIGSKGRRGVISLRALDLEYTGVMRSWTEIAAALLDKNKITTKHYQQIIWLESFGHLIANSDMHSGNLSFFADGELIQDLAPAYDMLPMQYAPVQGQFIDRKFDPELPLASNSEIWADAWIAAKDFWKLVSTDKRISQEFKIIAKNNHKTLSNLASVKALLPS